jgi:fluoroquinolone transport system permease protein
VNRVLSSLRWEVTLQYRNGFYYAVAFVLAIWVLLWTQLPRMDLSAVLAGILISNLLVTTFYFMAGMVMLEKGEGSLEARVVTPMRSGEYLLVKVLGLSALVLIENLVIAGLFSGFQFGLLPVALGLLLAGAIFMLFGFLSVIRYNSINEYLLPSVGYAFLLMLPLIDFFGLWKSPLFYLHPIQGSLVLVQAGFQPAEALEWLYGIGYSLIWLGLLFWMSRKALRRFVTGG